MKTRIIFQQISKHGQWLNIWSRFLAFYYKVMERVDFWDKMWNVKNAISITTKLILNNICNCILDFVTARTVRIYEIIGVDFWNVSMNFSRARWSRLPRNTVRLCTYRYPSECSWFNEESRSNILSDSDISDNVRRLLSELTILRRCRN